MNAPNGSANGAFSIRMWYRGLVKSLILETKHPLILCRVVEMAKQFPWAEVVGVDLALCPIPIEKRPNNTRFEIHDINTGLSNFEGQFDMVHLRFVGSSLKDFAQKMKDVHSCLKPGGIVLWVDADFELYSTDQFRKLVPATDAAPEGSWLQRFMVEGRRAYLRFGSDVEGMENAMDAGLWSDPILDPETCKAASLYLPIGRNIDSAQNLLSIGSLMTQNILNGLETAKPAFKRVGWPDATIDIWSTHVYNGKIKFNNKCKILTYNIHRMCGGEIQAFISSPPLPALITTTRDPLTEERPSSNIRPHYPYFFVYDSQEVSLEQAAIRNKDKALDLPPLPSLFV
ncbi:hypothetical protein CPB86DRAFT_811956 [Serendipita vermifera]|nr:hypothetical protein CPB86DRAFT_811956 [Serendipita vermifera]